MRAVYRSYSQIKGEMNNLILAYSEGEESKAIRFKAIELAKNFVWNDFYNAASLLFIYVRDQIFYISDPTDTDLYQSPPVTMAFGAGDCNNKVALLASLYRSVGYPVQVVWVFKNKPKQWDVEFPHHVFLRVDVKKTLDLTSDFSRAQWVSADTVPVMNSGEYFYFGQESPGGFKEIFLVDPDGPILMGE